MRDQGFISTLLACVKSAHIMAEPGLFFGRAKLNIKIFLRNKKSFMIKKLYLMFFYGTKIIYN